MARMLCPQLPRDPHGEYEKRIHINELDVVRLHHMLANVVEPHHIWVKQQMRAQARWDVDHIVSTRAIEDRFAR